MMPWVKLRRRSLMAAAVGGGIAWRGGLSPWQAASQSLDRSACGSGALAAVCADLRLANATGKACLQALPPSESSEAALTRAILKDMPPLIAARLSAAALAQAIRDRSRDDFSHGRIVSVDGWMFSLTETRLYALVALLSESRPTAG